MPADLAISNGQDITDDTTVIRHLETHLGPIVCGWSKDPDGRDLPFQVVLCQRTQTAGMNVLTTLGLSSSTLRVENGPKRLRQELVIIFRESDGPDNLPSVLQQLACEALASDRAFGIGDVIGPRDEIRVRSKISSFYVALPVYLPDSFRVCRETPEPVVFAWLVPISDTEAQFVRANGRTAFEEALADADPDLMDFERRAIR